MESTNMHHEINNKRKQSKKQLQSLKFSILFINIREKDIFNKI